MEQGPSALGLLVFPGKGTAALGLLLLLLLALHCQGTENDRDLIRLPPRSLFVKVLDSDSSAVGRDRREGQHSSFLE